MAATAHAALISLMNTVDQIQSHPRLSPCFDSSQFESLREMVDPLLDFVENHSDAIIIPEEDDRVLVDAESSDLLSRIVVAAQKAEDVIEVEAADRIRGLSTEESTSSPHDDLHKIVEAMDCIKEEVMKVIKVGRLKDERHMPKTSMAPPLSSSSSTATSPAAAKASKMVGFDKYMNQLLDRLKGDQRSRETIPIVGMSGIGKTTLARNAYDNSCIKNHFYVRAWVVVSQQFTRRDILLQALSSLPTRENDATDAQLGVRLHQILFNRRYLIVLDDLWSVESWEEVRFFFPDNRNGSRIVVTTRQRDVGTHLGSSSSYPLDVKFLDEKNSWELFCDKAFDSKCCPPELQGPGKEIVEKCGGLPLAITVIGGLLGKSPMTPEYWKKIARDKSQILEGSGEGNKQLSILYLSYKHLPVYLKSCFLCMGLFPEYHRINKPQLIQLWVAQGFIKADKNTCHSLEEVAESYIINLVDRNLLLVEDYAIIAGDRFYICYLHDVLRELCLKVAEKESFHRVQRDIFGRCRFIADEGNARFFYHKGSFERPSLIRPLIVDEQREREGPFRSRLLRVFVGDVRFLDHSQLINLRFFMVTDENSYNHPSQAIRVMPTYYSLATSISQCWSLQTLILDVPLPLVVPPEIWSIPHLNHINVQPAIYLYDPREDDAVMVLHNLQTLKRASDLNLSEDVCRRIPNIKEMEIGYNFENEDGLTLYMNLQNLGCFNKLEILRYACMGTESVGGDKLQRLKLPTSLKELTLTDCLLLGSDMAIIAKLPNLQLLNLVEITVVDKEWNFEHEGGFPSLEYLEIVECDDLVSWSSGDGSTFPVLKSLCLQHLSELQEIPLGIGDIPTLLSITVTGCGCEQVIISAVEILQEQEVNGNEGLKVNLIFEDKAEADMWKERIAHEMEFTSKQLRISFLMASSDNDSHSWVSTVSGYSFVPIEFTTS